MVSRCIFVLLLSLFLCTWAQAQSVRIQSQEIPYKMIEGKQMILRSDLAEVFPGIPDGEGRVDLAELIDNPNARILRRNGLIVSVRYHNREMAAIYGQTRAPRSAPAKDVKLPVSVGNFQTLMSEIVRLSNVEREEHDAPPLRVDSYMEQAALGHSREMARLKYFSHDSPVEGRETPSQRIRLTGCNARKTGENLAVSSSSMSRLANQTVQGWMNSPGHRRNLLDPGFTHIGIGVAKGQGRYYITQNLCAY